MKRDTLLKHKGALVGIVILFLTALAVTVGRGMLPYSSVDMDFVNIMTAPSLAHPFGTDSMGRDVLVRVLDGARVSLLISVIGVALAASLGTSAGLYAGFSTGVGGQLTMRVSDFLFSFPSFVLAIFLMVVLGFGASNTAIAIALIYLPVFVRLSRNLTFVVRDENYIRVARVNGQSGASILFREILPNILPPLLVQFTLGIAFGIVIEAGLSFLGLGVQPPAPSLGSIMADGREYFDRAPWVLTLTGLFISVVLLGMNLLGDGLRDLTDPRLKS
ncbi:ABC transporter permease [Burkholderia cenocepacia]|nr:ABC transporter permease [Burkholderia cenocepacia]RQZ83543.1 ABC transporter permease [Burkholderia cenocepacia]RRA04049.1 ABC transporter permease [Burkholderia cenocepacia]